MVYRPDSSVVATTPPAVTRAEAGGDRGESVTVRVMDPGAAGTGGAGRVSRARGRRGGRGGGEGGAGRANLRLHRPIQKPGRAASTITQRFKLRPVIA